MSTANVLDFYRAKAKQLINREFAKYGVLPAGMVVDLIFILLQSREYQLTNWQNLREDQYGCAPLNTRLIEVADQAIVENKRMIAALNRLMEEYRKTEYDNTPCSRI